MHTLNFASTLGDISILLKRDKAPRTCKYFIDLVRRGGLKNAALFRIVTTSGLQNDPNLSINVLQIGSTQKLDAERDVIPHESTALTGLSHRRWTVSAARFDCGEVYGSFFICLDDEPELDFGGKRHPDGQGFAAFGEVIAGFDTLEKLFAMAETTEILSNDIPIQNVAVTKQHQTWKTKRQ